MGSLSERKWGWPFCHLLYLFSPSPLYHQGSSTIPSLPPLWGSRGREGKTFKSVDGGWAWAGVWRKQRDPRKGLPWHPEAGALSPAGPGWASLDDRASSGGLLDRVGNWRSRNQVQTRGPCLPSPEPRALCQLPQMFTGIYGILN